jgi:hypothetical protein
MVQAFRGHAVERLQACAVLRELANTWRHSPSMRAIELEQPLAQADVALGVLEVAERVPHSS